MSFYNNYFGNNQKSLDFDSFPPFLFHMGLAAEKKTLTTEQYLELERKADFKSELINGEMYATVESLENTIELHSISPVF